jgi:hypothetical protein
MDIEKLKQSLARHFIAVMKGDWEDDWDEYWHYYAMCCNIMMILWQLKSE